ncbi:hypothetical protein O4H29_06735 [Marinobacter salarius]|uniref:hypothetical protein n=1 Tax=Marinobacter salarius TaxID=1420917 RepID=UPI0022B16CE4|nr:hypothetical protein [Marinobacter salarius]MCZ4284528.1 hypothetical protein [Marinobacter salarius]
MTNQKSGLSGLLPREPKIHCNMIFGHRGIKQFHRFENGKMVFYGYSIGYDKDGNETDRTEPTATGAIVWDDGSPFTESDRRLLSGETQPKRGLWARLFGG